MRNPMWLLEEKLDKVKNGERALERELVRSVRSVGDSVGVDAKFAAEVFRQVIHRLMLLMIEVGLLSLVRQLIAAPSTAQIHLLPATKPIS